MLCNKSNINNIINKYHKHYMTHQASFVDEYKKMLKYIDKLHNKYYPKEHNKRNSKQYSKENNK